MPAGKTPLRVAQPGEKAPEPPAENLVEAVEGSERTVLVMMRSELAKQIDAGVPAHALAPLSRQLLAVDKEIRLLELKAKQEAGDDNARPDEAWDSEAL